MVAYEEGGGAEGRPVEKGRGAFFVIKL